MSSLAERNAPKGAEQHAPSDNERYRQALLRIEEIANRLGLDHRFVGGTFTDLLNLQTTYSIDAGAKTIRLHHYTPLTPYRSDGTIKDVDMICFTPYRDDIRTAKRIFARMEKATKKNDEPFPHVALEETQYASWGRERKNGSNLPVVLT